MYKELHILQGSNLLFRKMVNIPCETCVYSETPPHWRVWPCLKHRWEAKKIAMNYFQMQYNSKILGYNNKGNPPDGNIVAWHDSQMFSSENKTNTCVSTVSKWLNLRCFCRNAEKMHPPSTRTPLICVRCIFWSRERESATRIFLHPSLRRI